MTPADAAFVRDFEAGRVESFHHRGHVRLAWAYLEQEPPARALERFAATVAEQVKETGVARSLDPMPSADRKVLHDALGAIDGVSSRSEGEDPNRRVVVSPT